jgi:NAD+ synthase (glutamine-hydrolysing)
MATHKIAAYQMTVVPDPGANFDKITEAIERAALEGAEILALPECALSGYPPLHYAHAADIDVARIAELNSEVALAAKANGIWVILGTICMSSEGLLNSALLISNDGEIAGRYDKLHLTGDDKHYFAAGVGAKVFDINGLKTGLLICYDVRFPEPFRYVREQGAELIVVILNACGKETWKLPVLEGAFRTRAAENSCFVAAANAAGPLQMAVSRICDPLGLDLASANQDQEEMLFAEIDPSRTRAGCFYDRRRDQFQVVAKFERQREDTV